jgi:polar amino acid transport system ATP-binding protein
MSPALKKIGDSTAVLQLRDLRKRFGAHTVLDGIDLDVGQSECVCIIGPSGSGKSTLLRCMAFLERCWSTIPAAASAWCSSSSTFGRT